MKKIILTALAVVLSAGMYAQVQNYAIGDVVDDFTVTDTDGVTWNLNELTAQGKYVYLDFFFDTCGPCQQTQPVYNEFHDKYGCNENNIFVISINNGTDSDAEVVAFEEQFGGAFQHAPAVSADGGSEAVDTAFGITAYPTYCLVGPDNTLVENDIWPIADVSTFENTIPAAANAQPMACSLGTDDALFTSFSMYPNPSVDGAVTINLPANANQGTVTVYNMLGKELLTESFDTNIVTFNTNFATGAYLVKVQSGTTVATQSLLIK